MIKTLCYGLFFVLSLFFLSCSTIQPGYETPSVSITSFEAIPGQGMVPEFRIGLHIVNPNRTPLNLKGISYTISIEGHKIITGVSNKLPRIQAYGEGDLVLNASMDIFSSLGFFTDLMQDRKKDKISYSLNAKLDAGSLHPLIRVTKKGKISLAQLQ